MSVSPVLVCHLLTRRQRRYLSFHVILELLYILANFLYFFILLMNQKTYSCFSSPVFAYYTAYEYIVAIFFLTLHFRFLEITCQLFTSATSRFFVLNDIIFRINILNICLFFHFLSFYLHGSMLSPFSNFLSIFQLVISFAKGRLVSRLQYY